ncbi:MAG: 3,4-dihydroxy-2-butanone-4-phosphate synthase, partial [Thermoleophilia bacterium]|nr:3,4-dihydroxy-2-butanone-4-phosphate synthase [Thermoleophilia bacterium]
MPGGKRTRKTSHVSNSPVTSTPFASIEAAIEDFRAGKMVVIVDSPDRENEGDVCVAAEHVTPEQITFMAIEARGLICLTLGPDKCDGLGLEPQVPKNDTHYETAFTVSIEAAEGVTTGISAADRAHTIRVAADKNSKPSDLVKPGHVFPLRAKPLGVLERTGQTEGSVDLAKLAGCEPAAVICEVMNDDGTMARVEDLVKFCAKHKLNMISIEDLIAYRLRTELQVERRVSVDLPTSHGHFNVVGYEALRDGKAHLAVVKGDVRNANDVLVRVHSECCTGDVFGSLRCDCGEQLNEALRQIEEAETGVLLFLAQEGRGI